MSKIQILKRKVTSFLDPEDRITVQNVVKIVHNIISEASHLLKAFYLFKIETEPDLLIKVDESLLSLCCKVVQVSAL
jgi:hypothetical protein